MEAIANRDPAAARRYMLEHIHQVQADVEAHGIPGAEEGPSSIPPKI
jgi:DNA-binding FadR family transcriptional regulator